MVAAHYATWRKLREEIDSQIEEVLKNANEQIRALREQRNTVAPIASLPSELLTQIFLDVRNAELESFGASGYQKPDVPLSAGLPTCSLVCRVWRDLAIGYSPLWTVINCNHTEWAKVMMFRAGNVSLDLRCQPGWYVFLALSSCYC